MFNNKQQTSDVVDLTLDEYYGRGNVLLSLFLKKALEQAVLYGFVEKPDFKYNVSRNPDISTQEINLIDHIVRMCCNTLNLGYSQNSTYVYINLYYVYNNNEVIWLSHKPNEKFKSKNVSISVSASMLDALQYAFALKALCFKVLTTALTASSTIQYKISGLRALERRDAEETADDIKKIKQGMQKIGKMVAMDSADDITTFTFDASNIAAVNEEVNQLISFLTGFPASYVKGTTTYGLNSSGDPEIMAVSDSLLIFYGIFLKPALEKIDEDNTSKVSVNRSPLANMEYLNNASLALSNIANAFQNLNAVPQEILDAILLPLGIKTNINVQEPKDENLYTETLNNNDESEEDANV